MFIVHMWNVSFGQTISTSVRSPSSLYISPTILSMRAQQLALHDKNWATTLSNHQQQRLPTCRHFQFISIREARRPHARRRRCVVSVFFRVVNKWCVSCLLQLYIDVNIIIHLARWWWLLVRGVQNFNNHSLTIYFTYM